MSSGGGGGGGRDLLDTSVKDCQDLKLNVSLASPKAGVISTLVVGDKLTLRLRGTQGPLEAIAPNGQVAGSILSPNLLQLIGCINTGYAFEATVISINGGNCKVRVEAI